MMNVIESDKEFLEELTDILSSVRLCVADVNDYKYGDLYQNIRFVRAQVNMRLAMCATKISTYAQQKPKSERDAVIWRVASGIANYDESTQETPRLLQTLLSLYQAKLISKSFSIKMISNLSADILKHDLDATDTHSSIPVHLNMFHGYPIYIELRNALGLNKIKQNEMDIIVDSKVFKRTAHGTTVINNLDNIKELLELNEDSRISLWLFARQITNTTSNVAKLNMLVADINSRYMHAENAAFIMGSWTSNPELIPLDTPILDDTISLDEFKSMTTMKVADINLRTQAFKEHDVLKYKDGSSVLIDPINQWIGKHMLLHVASGGLEWFNIRNFPIAHYPPSTLRLGFDTLSAKGSHLDRDYFAPKLIRNCPHALDMVNLMGLSPYNALEATCLESVAIEPVNIPSNLGSDLFV